MTNPTPATDSPRVLVVDDDPSLLVLCELVLRKLGKFEVAVAGSAELGLVAADRFKPHVVVSDISLPGLDGIDFVYLLQKRPHHRGTKYLIMSGCYVGSQLDPELLAMTRSGHLVEFLQKPFQVDEFVGRITGLLEQTGPSATVAQPGTAATTSPPVHGCDPVVAALAELTGGVCHDLANSVGAVLGNLELAEGCLDQRARLVEHLDRARTACGAATGMLRDLHAFARTMYAPERAGRVHFKGSQLAAGVRTLFEPRPVGLKVRAKGFSPSAEFPALLLRAVIGPLVNNASEALAKSAGPRIVVELIGGDGRLRAVVRDNGPGWPLAPADIAAQLTGKRPFTSKGPGHGQGLALVSRIAAKLGGALRLESQRPSGARVVVEFPWERS